MNEKQKRRKGLGVGKRHTQRPERIHNLIAGGCILLATASGLGILGESMEGWKIQTQYESLARMADRKAEGEKSDFVEAESQQERRGDRATETEKSKERGKLYQSPIDFEKLSEINPDITGWIRIPDTEIDYPIVQGSDNNRYLQRSFNGENADAGCIFLDFESQKNLRGYNNVLYGHNMKNGTMFRDVVRYKDESYFKEHRYFEIYTPEETIHLKAVSCYYIQDDPEVRRTKFRDEAEFDRFVCRMLKPCQYAEIPERPVENLYTLVTCSYESENTRTVLFAVEVDGKEMSRGTWQGESAGV